MARLCDLDPSGPTATAEISAALSSLASRPSFIHPQGTAPELPTVDRGHRFSGLLLRDILARARRASQARH